MKSTQDILSFAQSSLGDLDLTRNALGEYLSSLQDIANEIARETEVWIARYIAYPKRVGYDWSSTLVYNVGDIVLSGGIYYYCLAKHINIIPPNVTFWRVVTLWDIDITYQIDDVIYIGTTKTFYKARLLNTGIQPPNETYWFLCGVEFQNEYKINLPSNFKPFHVLRVLKIDSTSVYTEMREYSMQAVSRQSVNNNPFPINDVSFLNGYSTQHYNDMEIPGTVDNSITWNFNFPLSQSDSIYIDYTQGSPFEIDIWKENPPLLIPDFLVEAFNYGLLYKMLERLYMKGNSTLQNQMYEARRQYKGNDPTTKLGGALRRAMGYAQNFKSEEYHMKIQPLKFLASLKDESFG